MAAAVENVQPEPQGVSATAYAKNSRDVISLVNRFRATGAHYDLQLPTVVFVGDQSTGKSSLLEALCGVAFPRSDGTCTRCPTELRLTETSPNVPWTCTIKLRWEYDDLNHKKLNSVREEPFGPTLTEKSQVCDLVARAQRALLNPDKPAASFVGKNAAEAKGEDLLFGDASSGDIGPVKFTRNVVCVDIHGPDVANLTLIDLPGIIRSTASAAERHNVQLVEQLVKEYCKNEAAIIVAMVSCKQEMEGTVVRDLARDADNTGQRTIGVLTKPDTIERGTHQLKLDVLAGKSYQLELGYYVVKNRSPQQLKDNISFQEARESEREFFRTQEPWKTLPLHLKKRLGVDALETKLTQLLTDKILESLPTMKRTTGQLLGITRDMLAQIQPPYALTRPGSSNRDISARMALLTILRDFMDCLKDHIAATNNKDLWRAVHSHFREFWRTIEATRPSFSFKKGAPDASQPNGAAWWPFKPGEEAKQGRDNPASRAAESPNVGKKRESEKSEKSQDGSWGFFGSKEAPDDREKGGKGGKGEKSAAAAPVSAPPPAPIARADPPEKPQKTAGRNYTFDEVKVIIEAERGRQLPGNAPYEAKTRIINAFLGQWRAPAQELISKINASLLGVVRQVVQQRLGRWNKLQGLVSVVLAEFVRDLENETRATVNMLMDMEASHPFTLNSSYFDSSKAKYMLALRQTAFAPSPTVRKQIEALVNKPGEQRSPENDIQNALLALNKIGITGYNAETIKTLAYLPVTEKEKQLDEVLEVVAEVLAYFKVAFKRFGDEVPMAIDHQFLLRFSNTMETQMIEKLNLLEAEKAELTVLLDEDPKIVARREELLAKEQRLEEVWRELVKFGVRD